MFLSSALSSSITWGIQCCIVPWLGLSYSPTFHFSRVLTDGRVRGDCKTGRFTHTDLYIRAPVIKPQSVSTGHALQFTVVTIFIEYIANVCFPAQAPRSTHWNFTKAVISHLIVRKAFRLSWRQITEEDVWAHDISADVVSRMSTLYVNCGHYSGGSGRLEAYTLWVG
jgi:hypothetical protein